MKIHKIIPKQVRARLLRNQVVEKVFRSALSGRVITKSWVGTTFHFDGYRNFGFWTVDLEDIEASQRALAKAVIQGCGKGVIFDVGANVGFWTLWLHSITSDCSTIVAFEPDPENLKYLVMNIEKNGLGNKSIINDIALSDQTGYAILDCDETGAMNTLMSGILGSEITVKTLSMDKATEIYGIPDFVKVDVEGHEYEVLLGARKVLEKGKTIWLVEVTRNGDAVLQLLNEYGYVVTDLHGRPLQRPEYYVAAYPRQLAPPH